MSLSQIAFIFILIALNAFFVGVEFAAVASRRTRLELVSDPASRAAKLVHRWLEDETSRDRLIAATQLGITLVSLALGAVGENAFEALLEPYFHHINLPPALAFLEKAFFALPLIISLTVVTALHVVLGEQVPKVAVLRSPEKFALAAAPAMNVFSTVFGGFVGLLDWATRGILRLIGLPPNGHAHSAVNSIEELKQIVASPEVGAMVDPPERAMLTAIIDFGELLVRHVSVPRTNVVAVQADTSLRETIRLAAIEGLTKLPVYEENLDQIVGILHVKDVLLQLDEGSLDSRTAREIVREAFFVPDSIPVNDLLAQFRAQRQHIAITLDEFGGTAGLVTLEDLLEEIVGDMQDSAEAEPPPIQLLPDGSSRIDGMTLIEEINHAFGLELEDPNYDTIAGYLLGRLGHIPQAGECFEDGDAGIRLRVEQMERLRIAQVGLERLG